jgi:cytochrome bd-type quinol oxidase subunit 2
MKPRLRKTVMVIHVVGSVGLLGSVATLLLIAIIAATTNDAQLADSAYRLMQAETMAFGIPLSFISLLSGIALGLGTRWRVLRYWWTALKLGAIVAVILMGALVIGPAIDAMRDDPEAGAEWRIITAATLDVILLGTSVVLSIFKPGGRVRAQRAARSPATGQAAASSPSK